MMLRLPDTGAETLPDGRRVVPSAQRNAPAILAVLQGYDLRGQMLEIASGSGLHAAHIAPHFPQLKWQPTDIDPENLPSIRAWTAGIASVLPPVILDATQAGWHETRGPQDAILLVNLLHLIPQAGAQTLLRALAAALATQGHAFIYGPFLRNGQTTSAGDAAFDASLRAQDAQLGYKDIAWVTEVLSQAGLHCTVTEMPANNLMICAVKIAKFTF